MSARHRQPATPDQARYRAILVGLVVVFLLAFLVLRVFAGDDGETPTASDSSTTSSSTAPTGDTTVSTSPGSGGGESTTTSSGSALAPLQAIRLDPIYEGLAQPVALAAPPGDDRLFINERGGRIRVIDADGALLEQPFIDLTDRVLAGGIEQGLLGLAFHPDYASNGRFFVYFTDKGGNRQLSEFTVTASDPNRASADSEKVIFEFPQPPNAVEIRHYAGNVAFGPDGYIWVSMGDGADSRAQGQDPNTPYGTIFRIDVDSGDPYAVPDDNPFVDGGGMPEVWAYGLRNPWRFAIDPVDRMVYVADVGHAVLEEVNVVPLESAGYNFGWSNMEATRCFHETDCDPADYTAPVITYPHEGEDVEFKGLSVTGGYVYRGSEIPEIDGIYFYSDWVSQWIRGLKFVDGQVVEDRDWTADLGGPVGGITSFGLDGHGELYVVTFEGGVFKFTAVR